MDPVPEKSAEPKASHKSGLLRRVAEIDKRFAWSFLGVLLTVALGIPGLYLTLYYARVPQLEYDIVSSTDVVTVSDRSSDVHVLFKGRDIIAEGLNLRVITLRIANKGSADILQGQYDLETRFGCLVSHGQILDALVVKSNSAYLKEKFEKLDVFAQFIRFPYAIIESSKFVDVKATVLHKRDEQPQFYASGKIAGVDAVNVKQSYGSEARSYIATVYGGSVLTQVLRTTTYPLVLILAIILMIMVIALMALPVAGFQHYSRKRVVRQFVRQNQDDVESQYKLIFELFQDGGVKGLQRLRDILGDADELRDMVRYGFSIRSPDFRMQFEEVLGKNLSKLVEVKAITIDDRRTAIDDGFLRRLERFASFAKPWKT